MGQPIKVEPNEPPKDEEAERSLKKVLIGFCGFVVGVASISGYYIHVQNSHYVPSDLQLQASATPAPPGYDLLDRDGTIIANTHLRVIVPGGLALGASVLPGTRAHCIAINERQGAKVRLESGPEKGDEGYIDLADFRPDSP